MTLKQIPRLWLYLGLAVVLLILAFGSLSAGRVWTPLASWFTADDPRSAIVFGLRLPRTILAIMVGAALGLSGAALQGYTRNPLADPGVLGISPMAALGAVATLYFGVAAEAPWILPVAAMLGAAIGVVVLLALAGATSSVVTFVLAGMIVQTVASAGVALALNLAPNPWAVNEIINWLMGSVADRSVEEVRLALPGLVVGGALLLTLGRALDALTVGDVGARSLGVNLKAARIVLVVGMALAVGSGVAVTGVIGFIGLVTPHLLRPFVGSRPGALLGISALGGAILTLAADILVRMTPAASEIKLSVAMAALGGPFFLIVLIARRRRVA